VSGAWRAYDARVRAPSWNLPVECGSTDSYCEVMRKPWIRGLAGIVAFALPALMCVIGMPLDRSSLGHDPTYKALILPVLCSSLLLAAVVPAALILTSTLSLPRRIGLTAAMWCLLALECGLAFYIVLGEGLR
jgi:hypothetical protein